MIETNAQNNLGAKEDAKSLDFALTILIFYSVFLVERVGSYMLDIVH